MPEPTVVCVLGMHRSGTSLLSRILNVLGVYLGPEEHLMDPSQLNPTGFWEHQQLSELNEEILVRLGGSWHDPPNFPAGWEASPNLADLRKRARTLIRSDFGDAKLWGWKDPRTCLTLPFWRRLLPSMRYLVCLRNPLDVAASIEGTFADHLIEASYSFEHGVDLWLTYIQASLEHSVGAKRLLVSYEQVMSDPKRELERLAAFVGRQQFALKPKIQSSLQEFIDGELWHHRCSLVDVAEDPRLAFPAKSLYLALAQYERLLAASAEDPAIPQELLEPLATSALAAQVEHEGLAVTAEVSRQTIADQTDSLTALSEEGRAREAVIAEQTHSLTALSEDLRAREAVIAEQEAAKSVAAEMERELAGLRPLLAERADDIAALRSEVGAHQASAQVKGREFTALRDELDRRSDELAAARKQLAEREASAGETRRELEALRTEERARRQVFSNQERALGKLRRNLTTVEKRSAGQGRTLARTQAELAAKEIEVAALRERLRPEPVRRAIAARTAQSRGRTGKCSIVIPVFNKASLTRDCLKTLLKGPQEKVDFEIVVVDDASTDTTPELLAAYGDRIRVVTNASNAGFAATCNAGAVAATGNYLVFLNNDTIPRAGWLEALVGYAEEHEHAAVVGSKLVFPNNTVQHAGVVIAQDRYPRHIYGGFPADHHAVNKSRQFQIVTAACMLVRQADFDDVGGFDTAFQNGYEDVDLCLRLGERGREVHYCHESVVTHFESASRLLPASGQLPSHEVAHNTRLYLDRWAARVQPDDFRYYLEDSLLQIGYSELYPLQLAISPELAVLLDGDREPAADRLLRQRSRQVFDLLRDTIRLNVQVAEAELQAGHASQNGHAPSAPRPLPAAPVRIAEGEVHWLTNEPSDRLVSVILPVKNGADRLRELLPRVLAQRTRDNIEIVAVDSGSDDDTIGVLREFRATVVSIDPASFNHGLTRNVAAAFARGDVFVFLNQSAMPVDENWLDNLVSQLDRDPLVAGVCSRVLPRDDADVLTRRDGLRDPSASTERQIRRIDGVDKYPMLSSHQLRLLVNFHTVSAAIRPEVLARIPFRNVLMGEDLLWAKEVLESRLKIQHEPSSVVVHSHSYSYGDLLRRNVDDGFANRQIVDRRLDEREVVPTIASLVRDDWDYLERECELDATELEHWRLESALRRSAQIVGQWLGVNREQLSEDLFAQLSLTERIRNGTSSQRETSELRPGSVTEVPR